jgi:hypothetical protein
MHLLVKFSARWDVSGKLVSVQSVFRHLHLLHFTKLVQAWREHLDGFSIFVVARSYPVFAFGASAMIHGSYYLLYCLRLTERRERLLACFLAWPCFALAADYRNTFCNRRTLEFAKDASVNVAVTIIESSLDSGQNNKQTNDQADVGMHP